MLNFFASNTKQQMPENCGGQLVRQSCCWLIANYQVIGVLICTAYQMSQAIFCNSQKCRQYQFFHSAPSMLWYGLELRVSIFFRFKTVTFATFSSSSKLATGLLWSKWHIVITSRHVKWRHQTSDIFTGPK